MGRKSDKYDKKYGPGVRRVGSKTTKPKPPASSPWAEPGDLKIWLEERVGDTLARTFKTGLDPESKNYLYARCYRMKIVSVDELVELSIVSYDIDDFGVRDNIAGEELGNFLIPIKKGGTFEITDAAVKACDPKFYKKYKKAA